MRTYQFTHSLPTTVYFGDGAIANLAKSLAQYGKKVLLVYGGSSIKKSGLYDTVTAILRDNGFTWWELSGVKPNPEIASVDAGGKMCREHGVEVVLAVGGGSSVDCAKGICAAAFYEGPAWDLAEDRSKFVDALPLVDVLTLAATGSEMDPGGVITNPEKHIKSGIFHPKLMPKVSILDPVYTYTVPRNQTAAGTADIYAHTVETYFDPAMDLYFIDGIAESILRTCVKYGRVAMDEPTNFEARANLMWASPWAINGMIGGGRQSGWTLHGLQHPIGAYYDNTHGDGLAILMPHWFRKILSEDTVDMFVKYGVNVFGIDKTLPKMEIAKKAIEATEDFLFNQMEIPRTLSAIGVDDKHIEDMAAQAAPGMAHSFVPLSYDDCVAIYKAAL
jgi:butanol dehydrogenase